MKKISEWLSELSSHGIYSHEAALKDFQQSTGFEDADWPAYTVKQTREAISSRGLGGSVQGKGLMCYGWDVAEWLADHYAPDVPRKSYEGRGSRFREAICALRTAGK